VIDGIIINLRQKKADMQRFVTEVFQILPLLNLTAFEFPKAVAEPMTKAAEPSSLQIAPLEIDTIIVPAQKDSFEKAFLATNPWWAVRISGGMLPKIKYIAAYQSQPVSTITHVALVSKIEPHGGSGKYKADLFSASQAYRSNPVRRCAHELHAGTEIHVLREVNECQENLGSGQVSIPRQSRGL
jgi:hypothetical protein